jgi:uncharacterized protein with von Willebrand factor type A (vWA) domain
MLLAYDSSGNNFQTSIPILLFCLRNVTEELQSIHKQDRDEMKDTARLNEDIERLVNSERDSLQAEFSLEREELNQLVKKTEDERNQAKEMYENMLANVQNELGKNGVLNDIEKRFFELIFSF